MIHWRRCDTCWTTRGKQRTWFGAGPVPIWTWTGQLNLALVRLMEVVGEAATRVPEEFRARHPQVPWRDVADLRNRLIHGYDTVDFDRLWAIIRQDIPPLIDQLEAVLRDLG